MKHNEQNDWRNFLDDTTMEGTYIDQFKQDRGLVVKKKEYKLYSQHWHSYNEAQTREKLLFLDILGELCSFIPPEKQTMGRPRIPLSEMVYSCVLKVYEQLSSRRVSSDLEIAGKMGYLERTPPQKVREIVFTAFS